MDPASLVPVMTAAVVISAIALVIQTGILFGMFKAVQEMRERILHLLPKVEGLVDASKVAVEEGRAGLAEVRVKSNTLLDSAQRQVNEWDIVLTDASERTRRQLDHAERVVQETLSRVDETAALVQRGILKPIRGVTGIVAAVQAMATFYMRGRRPSPDRATSDEEMFI